MRLFGQQRRAEWSALKLETSPQAGEVIVEIGLVLAAHLAIALLVCLVVGGN